MSGLLWRNYRRQGKSTQADDLLSMLRTARANGEGLPLFHIMGAGIAQHGARFNELRSRGFVIHNELHRESSGIVRSKYWLKYDPEKEGVDEK
jgi:hypothetical protein